MIDFAMPISTKAYLKTNQSLDKTFGVRTSYIKINEDTEGFLPLNSRCSYPWDHPEYKVGDGFFVPRSEEDVRKGKGRPGVPQQCGGRIWRTHAQYHEPSEQYGYRVIRIK